VKLYASMKPRDAAKIFDDLDTPVLLEVVDRMNERKAAPILAAMQPDRAREVTEKLAATRLKRTTPASN
jgi:flagellar motility protein MotE (MotC chaperone)